jgi:hypothetical protein
MPKRKLLEPSEKNALMVLSNKDKKAYREGSSSVMNIFLMAIFYSI